MDPSVIRQVRYEELQKFREHVKESEDKWQDVSRDYLQPIAQGYLFVL